MAASGLTLNSPCYSALITAHQNSRPVTQETFDKVDNNSDIVLFMQCICTMYKMRL